MLIEFRGIHNTSLWYFWQDSKGIILFINRDTVGRLIKQEDYQYTDLGELLTWHKRAGYRYFCHVYDSEDQYPEEFWSLLLQTCVQGV